MAEKVKDPVCGMEIDSERAAARVEHGGRTWWFCSEGCRRAFEQDPARYAGQAAGGGHGGGHGGHG